MEALDALARRIAANRRPRLLRFLGLGGAQKPVAGLYLWGGVGRGKSFLMDLFVESLEGAAKRRVHFHRLMSEVHARRRALAQVEDPLDRVAADLAADIDILCLDEFFVSDIGDAMILARLLAGLFRRGVVLVATSNAAPADLYRGGLQRERFLPAIELLEKHTRVVRIEGDTDYRLRLLEASGTFMSASAAATDAHLDRYFRQIASQAGEEHAVLTIAGRDIRTRKRARGIAWFEFRELCEGPRGADDYIEIARRHSTVILSSVPVLTAEREDAARRFITLVDELYDRRVKLILAAETDIASLYRGRRLAAEFERTASRLAEMQTSAYLHAEHLS